MAGKDGAKRNGHRVPPTTRKAVMVRLDRDAADGLADLAYSLELTQSALLEAAIDIWVGRWREMRGDARRFSTATPATELWLERARQITEERKGRKKK